MVKKPAHGAATEMPPLGMPHGGASPRCGREIGVEPDLRTNPRVFCAEFSDAPSAWPAAPGVRS